MNSQDNSDNKSPTSKSGKWSRRKLFAVFGTASLLAVGAFASVAQSGGGFFGHGMGGHRMGGFMHGSHDPAGFEKHLDKKLKHFAIEFEATDEQQEKLKTVITALVKEVRPLKTQLRETREQLHSLLIQPKIDRVAIENLRAEKIALVETLSKKATQAMADAGEILSLEQRVKLGDFIGKFSHRRHRWHRG